MHKAKSIGCLVLCGVAVLAAQNSPVRSAKPTRLKKELSRAASIVRQKTAVPLRLPTRIAGLDNAGKNDLYAIESADKAGYSIILAATPDCEGQHVCSYGTVSGGTDSFRGHEDVDRPRTQVKLENGITAYFYDTVCGAYCDESWITWREGKFHYTISLKAGSKSDLVGAANSAIRAGAKTLGNVTEDVADARYYPISVGDSWTYEVERRAPKATHPSVTWTVTHSGIERGRTVYQIWPKPMQSDDEAMSLAVMPEGIVERSGDTVILRFPVRTGAKWSHTPRGAKHPRSFSVLSANRPCEVGSRKIEACVVIEERDLGTRLRVVTTYGRDIGPVRYEYYRTESGKEVLVQTVSLVEHKAHGS